MITLERNRFLSALNAVAPAVPKRTPKEILKNFKLSTREGVLRLYGTGLEVAIEATLGECNSFSTLLPLSVHEIMRVCDEDSVQISTDQEQVLIKTERSEWTLAVPDVAEYPTHELQSPQDTVTVYAPELQEGIARTLFSVDDERTRYAMNGVHVDLSGRSVHLVSTDSRRLSVYRGDALQGQHCEPFVVPAHAMRSVSRAIGDEEVVRVTSGRNSVQFDTAELSVWCLFIEGRYPKWQDVIPADSENATAIDPAVLLNAVRQAMITADEERHEIVLRLDSDILTVTSQGAEIGGAKVQVPVHYKHDPVEVSLSGEYLKDYLGTVKGAQVCLHVSDANSAIKIVAPRGVYVLMPLARD